MLVLVSLVRLSLICNVAMVLVAKATDVRVLLDLVYLVLEGLD